MADIAREMEDFKAANRTFGGEWKLEMKGNNNSSSNQPSSSSSSCSTTVQNPPPQPIPSSTESTYKDVINKYKKYNYNNSNVTRVVGVGDLELKRQRRVVKYKSYAVESQLK